MPQYVTRHEARKIALQALSDAQRAMADTGWVVSLGYEAYLKERIALLESVFGHTFQPPAPGPGDWDCERCKACGLNIRDAIHGPLVHMKNESDDAEQ